MRIGIIETAAALLLLAGCGSTVVAEKQARDASSPFAHALTAQYKAYAAEQVGSRHWGHAKYFAKKGLAAAYGADVPPEELSNWRIPDERQAEMAAARRRLVSALDGGARQRKPQEAARAQVRFDCWVETEDQAHASGNDPDDNRGLIEIASRRHHQVVACKNGFFSALSAIEKK